MCIIAIQKVFTEVLSLERTAFNTNVISGEYIETNNYSDISKTESK